VQVGLATLELLLCILTFHKSTGTVHRSKNPASANTTGASRTTEALKNPITWICACFLLCYVCVTAVPSPPVS
jgi:hypothetical protein